ncbi:flagellar protein FliS [Alkalithermobacter thermoalcaliphilus JW-YL-7 = DSM 7308]|uniref:Flagellar protein FliS n=1 Tax=Alkalithermobacter thermoalcaliphilus JW-YL-7 = DSM 7308 TaxID=1121328 RepID=A0A150FPG4_CLOPD|nr:flagellar protein FliS [[Clostridium] paradoxum JW-YL-7 = DSM 7308]SHL06512.1 flagellar protein FliS [[Clostridium] paradoxum JW-YL-7 = DSM 7308]
MIEKEYLASRVMTANDAQLVAILYEGLIDTINEAIENINEKEKLERAVNKIRDILAELLSTLKGDSDIANNLRSLYIYINRLITDGQAKKDIQKFKDAIKVITPLYEGWSELGEKISKEEGINPKKPAIVAGATYGKGHLNDYVVNDTNKWDKG